MKVLWHEDAWKEFEYWLDKDLIKAKKIRKLIHEIQRTPYDGIGKPEALKHSLQGWYSRRINLEHRLIYKVDKDTLYILNCKYHY
jgi:toxin YoeB